MVPIRKKLYRKQMLHLLDKLEGISEPAMTIYLPPEFTGLALDSIASLIPRDARIPVEAVENARKSATGAVYFWGESIKYVIVPPFPVDEKRIAFGYEVDGLRRLLNKQLTLGIILLRLGRYGIGVFKGETLLASKVGTGLVHARHKKGGSSQHRFERHREKQMEYFFSNVCLKAKEKLEPYRKDIDYIIYCGEKRTVESFIRQCQFMQGFKDKTMPRLLDIRKPGQQSLLEAIDKAWAGDVIEWHDTDAATDSSE